MKVVWLYPAAAVALVAFAAIEASSFITPSDGIITWSRSPAIAIAKTLKSKTSFDTATTLKMAPDTGRKLVTMGRIPWQKLRLSREQGREIISIIRSETHTIDLSLMLILAFFSERIGKFLFNRIFRRFAFAKNKTYDESITKKFDESLGQVAKLGLVCYILDGIEIFLEVAGMKGRKNDWSTLAAKLIYATWIIFRVRLYKRHLFEAAFDYASKIGPKNATKRGGKVDIVDKISDFFLFAVLAFLWIDILQIKRGNALSSIFALGGAGTLALTLALQDLAKRLINGLAISTSDAFDIGDKIILGDGTSGTVVNVGWLSTEIRADDEIITKIPNTQLSSIRVSNLSSLKMSQVKQTLCFTYNYLNDIPELVNEIKKEIVETCDKVITDGSRSLRVVWTGYTPMGLEVDVNCKLSVPPKSGAYHKARQEVMEAIARVVKRKGVEFSPPTEVKLMGGGDKAQDLIV